MRLNAFEQQVRDCLPADEATGKRLSLSDLCRGLGIGRATLYRVFRKPPWESGRSKWTGKLFARLATALMDSRNALLWLAGYNPFVESGLSPNELRALYEVNAKIVAAVLGGHFDGDLKTLASLASGELARSAKTRKAATKCSASW